MQRSAIKKIPHKAAFQAVIQGLQRRSAEYHRWKKEHLHQPQDTSEDKLSEERASPAAAVSPDAVSCQTLGKARHALEMGKW